MSDPTMFSSHPILRFREGVKRASKAMKEVTPEEGSFDPESTRAMSRRGLLQAGLALITFKTLESLFKVAEANDQVPGEHHFTPQNIEKLNIDTTSKLLDLAREHGYIPTETADSKFSYSKFADMADRASLHEVRQFFRSIEMLRNDGFFDSKKEMEEVHAILASTPDIAPVRTLLLTTLGARAKDGSGEVIHGLTKGEFFSMLQEHLPRYEFPHRDHDKAKTMNGKFASAVHRQVNTSIQNRGVGNRVDAILAANDKLSQK